ncbi:MAG: type II toxin-antitoxin system prevent-host-death family antitoxin [Bifidobacteriaceae bacterium]|jgi:prevent-host-death family protein|nr:type II toxin-antitoxin system prevent-host-death family antitoxin [Bifidobacteriaceae bacterium]
MTITMNIQEAKGRLSYLVAQAEQGRDVIIARAGRPVARLQALDEAPDRRLGLFPTDLDEAAIAESMAPLNEADLALWSGRGE